LKVNGWNHESSLSEDSTIWDRNPPIRYTARKGRNWWVLGLAQVVHFLKLSAEALTRGMTRAAVCEGMRKVAGDGLVPFTSVTSVSSALARSVASRS
jgi:hypothetical protein